MSRKSFYEKANELIELAKEEENPEIRVLRLRAAKKYYKADVPGAKPGFLVFFLFYAVIFATIYISFSQLGFFLGAGVVIGTYALATLMMGVILRMRDKLTEKGLLAMVREGFKALNLLRRH